MEDLVRLWVDRNICVWKEFVSISLMRAHMLEMSNAINDIGGMDLVAEKDGRVIAVGWVGMYETPTLRGKPVMHALGVDPMRADFDTVVEEMLAFVRREGHGDKNLGRLSDHGDPDVRP